MPGDIDTSQITDWRSIVTLIVFVLTNITVLFPFQVPVYVPRPLSNTLLDSLSALRIIAPRQDRSDHESHRGRNGKDTPFIRLDLPMNFVTAPLVADLFLLAILAIGRDEVYGGVVGADHIAPFDVMVFFITLAYVAISIDASGLIRYLAYIVLQKGGKVGPRLFFYLYTFFFVLASIIGNDPIILCGTAFLAYMTRVSSNIVHPRAWIHTQFAVANIASAILVSSNPTNLVLAGAFSIKFVDYTANMIVPVLITAIVLFPFLLYVVFADISLIPESIKMHELSEEARSKKPVNPNIPHSRRVLEEEGNSLINSEQARLISLEEIMNPFLDKKSAIIGTLIMVATLITVLAVNAASRNTGEYPVFWVTLPAACLMFCWDIASGWYHRHETREIARNGRQELERARAERTYQTELEARLPAREQEYWNAIELRELGFTNSSKVLSQGESGAGTVGKHEAKITPVAENSGVQSPGAPEDSDDPHKGLNPPSASSASALVPRNDELQNSRLRKQGFSPSDGGEPPQGLFSATPGKERGEKKQSLSKHVSHKMSLREERRHTTLISVATIAYRWSQETFPTATAVLGELPFALVPFALSMFVLVQGLVTKGWVQVFGYGWDHWVDKTGTVGAIGGMGFISVILCNFAGTNIGTTILLSRVVQAWQKIHRCNGIPISNRTFWATVYGMALGVNYGAFSTSFSASLAGLLWRDILARKQIHALSFARVNLPIIAIAMAIGCTAMIGEVYIIRNDSPFDLSSISVVCS